ncbi:efflux RND transporter permease subunit [Leucobacter chromiireducens]|uniref:efflux RND transporter permease subunit n=1 Tax=Leucobacter chromiireducens TaxID=283877 RepID=UPI003F7E4992
MHQLTALSLKNRALIALVTIVAAVFGLIGMGSLKQELMPSVQFPAIAVVTSYPGASPEVVNADVSEHIETALRGVPNLESSTATSSTGASMVLAQFTYGVDIAATEQKVERAISRISKMLPAAADTQVMSGSIDDFPVIQIAVTPAEGETPEHAAELVTRIAVPEISDLPGVRDAQLAGARPDRVTITPNAAALASNGLTAQSITDTLQQSGVLVAAGTVSDGDRTLAVQAGSDIDSAEQIGALPIAVSAGQLEAQQRALVAQQEAAAEQLRPGALPGALPEVEPAPALEPLKISDVADVELGPGPVESISRVDGAPALTIGVTKMSAANTVDVSHAVQEKLDELADQLGGAKLSVIFDQAPYVEQSIETLTTEGMLGLVFAVLVILVFLMSIRATLVTAISIPTSVLLTFVGLNFADYTLNMLTLGALTISIGRVVDDSIVVIENIKRHLVNEGDRAATIVRAVREVAGAITASTVTTVAVFLPMAFVGGMVGELFRPFAFTVTIALAASLLVSLTIVPVLAYWFLRPENAEKRLSALAAKLGRPGARRATARLAESRPAGQPTALQRWYRPVIDWTLRRPGITLMIAALVFGGTVAATPLMKTNFMGSDEQNSVGLVQTLAPGTSLDAQLAQAKRVEEALADVPAVETVQVTVGSTGGGMAAIFGGGGDGAINYSLTTNPDADQAKVQDDIRAAVKPLTDAGEFSLGQSGGGVTMSSAIEVGVTAPDQATLEEASDAVLTELRAADGLKQVESDLGQSRPYLSVTVNREAAAKVGLSEAAVAGQVAQQMQPTQIGQISIDDSGTSVYLAAADAPNDEAGVAALQIQTADGARALSSLATVEIADGPVTIRTEDTSRMVTISALPQGDDLSAASTAVNQALDRVKLPAGASAKIGGVMSQQSEAFGQLGLALLVAILIVYVVMVATFRSLLQPLLLLISVPFAATGAILLLIATGIPLGVASLIGVLMLIGIVVTNAIVLIDLVNQYRERGDSLHDAVVHGALQRLRPIVMTALATILALTPMGIGITGKGGFISQPLAIVVIGGLLSSTLLTLIVLPTLYYAVERRREGGAERRRARRAPKRGGDGEGLVLAGAGLAGASLPATSGEPLVAATAADSGAGGAAHGAHGAHAVTEAVADPDPIPAADPAELPEFAAEDLPAPVSASNAAALVEEEPLDAAEVEEIAAEVERAEALAAEEAQAAEEARLAEEALAAEEARAVEAARVAEVEAARVAEAELARAAELEAEQAAAAAAEAEEAARRQQILSELVQAGLAAPETSGAHASVTGSADADPDPSASETAAIELPSAPEPAGTDADMGPATQQMSMNLSELGFTGEHNPLTDSSTELEAEAVHSAEEPDVSLPEPEPEPEPELPEQPVDVTPEIPQDAFHADSAAPPVTGELNWEQLLWQATQDIDAESDAPAQPSDGSANEHPTTGRDATESDEK